MIEPEDEDCPHR